MGSEMCIRDSEHRVPGRGRVRARGGRPHDDPLDRGTDSENVLAKRREVTRGQTTPAPDGNEREAETATRARGDACETARRRVKWPPRGAGFVGSRGEREVRE